MRLSYLVLLAIAISIVVPSRAAHAQISFGIQIGGGYPEAPPPPPVCPYGYYAYPPYNCAPVGYYGSDWFNDGMFIGAGPWYNRGWGYRDGWDHDRGGWGHDRGGWGGGRGYVGGGFHGGGGGFHGRGGDFHGGGFHGGGGGSHGGGRRH